MYLRILALLIFTLPTSANAEIINLTFNASITSKDIASIGQGIPSANPVLPGTYINWERDNSYNGEQFKFNIQIDSSSFVSYIDTYPDNTINNFAQYSSIDFSSTSLATQNINSVSATIATTPDERLAFTREPAIANTPSDERIYMYYGNNGGIDTRVGDDRLNESHKDLLFLTRSWQDILRSNNEFISSHGDFVSLLEDLIQNNDAGFGLQYLATNTIGAQKNYYTTNDERFIYSSVEGVRFYGNAHLTSVTTVPVPAALWLFFSGLIFLFGSGKKREHITM